MRKILFFCIIAALVCCIYQSFKPSQPIQPSQSLQSSQSYIPYNPYVMDDSTYNAIIAKISNWDTIYEEEVQDSIIVLYRQKVNGYKVKAVLKPYLSDVMVLAADIYFTKNRKTFMLHTTCFGDTMFCKGRLDLSYENEPIYDKFRQKTVHAKYVAGSADDGPMRRDTPFFFKDLDFDGIPELVIVHKSMAGRYHDGYDVYRIVEGQPVLIDYPPYHYNDDFGMTDYPEFDYRRKTISCPYPEGEIHYGGRITYGIGKKKDVVTVNGRKHYFNKMVVIKKERYREYE